MRSLEVKPKTISASVKIIRDGKEIDLGVVSFYSSNPIHRVMWKIKGFIKRLFRPKEIL